MRDTASLGARPAALDRQRGHRCLRHRLVCPAGGCRPAVSHSLEPARALLQHQRLHRGHPACGAAARPASAAFASVLPPGATRNRSGNGCARQKSARVASVAGVASGQCRFRRRLLPEHWMGRRTRRMPHSSQADRARLEGCPTSSDDLDTPYPIPPCLTASGGVRRRGSAENEPAEDPPSRD